MIRRRHVAIRTCIGCGGSDRQGDMLRIVRDADGELGVDRGRRLGGRGGYLHRRHACWTHFARRKGTVRSLRASVDRPARAALVAALAELGAGE